jgi:hypothetical protein
MSRRTEPSQGGQQTCRMRSYPSSHAITPSSHATQRPGALPGTAGWVHQRRSAPRLGQGPAEKVCTYNVSPCRARLRQPGVFGGPLLPQQLPRGRSMAAKCFRRPSSSISATNSVPPVGYTRHRSGKLSKGRLGAAWRDLCLAGRSSVKKCRAAKISCA